MFTQRPIPRAFVPPLLNPLATGSRSHELELRTLYVPHSLNVQLACRRACSRSGLVAT